MDGPARAPRAGTTAAEQDAHAALARLAQAATAAAGQASLTRLAELTVQVVPGAEGAGVTVLDAGRAVPLACSHPFVRDVVELTRSTGEGPGLRAAATARPVVCGTLGSGRAWPRFGPAVAHDLGVHSALCLPLLVAGEVVGTLEFYARRRDAFGEQAVAAGRLVAPPAAVAVAGVCRLRRSQRVVDRLDGVFCDRATVDRAVGVIRARRGGSADDALALLRSHAAGTGTGLVAVAASIVESATGRAQGACRPDPGLPAT